MDDAIFFSSPGGWADWLGEHGEHEDEIWVGLWKQATGKPSLSWAESVDEALCHGWIDGIRQTVDDDRYRIRFTPSRSRSRWSAKNLARAAELEALGRMRPAGTAVLEARMAGSDADVDERASQAQLSEVYQQEFRRSPSAWTFFAAQPPGYRRKATQW